MGKLKLLSGMLLLSAMIFGSVSCSNNDDPDGGTGSGVGTGTCHVDGRTISYNRGYYYKETYGTPGTIELIFADCDVTTLPNQVINGIFISFTTSEDTLPEGTFPYSNSEEDMNTWGYVEIYDYNPTQDVEFYTYNYMNDWNNGYESGDMVVTRNGSHYRIEINDLKLLKDADEDGGIGSFDPKTSGSFVWEGELMDLTSWMNMEGYGRSLSNGRPWGK